MSNTDTDNNNSGSGDEDMDSTSVANSPKFLGVQDQVTLLDAFNLSDNQGQGIGVEKLQPGGESEDVDDIQTTVRLPIPGYFTIEAMLTYYRAAKCARMQSYC